MSDVALLYILATGLSLGVTAATGQLPSLEREYIMPLTAELDLGPQKPFPLPRFSVWDVFFLTPLPGAAMAIDLIGGTFAQVRERRWQTRSTWWMSHPRLEMPRADRLAWDTRRQVTALWARFASAGRQERLR